MEPILTHGRLWSKQNLHQFRKLPFNAEPAGDVKTAMCNVMLWPLANPAKPNIAKDANLDNWPCFRWLSGWHVEQLRAKMKTGNVTVRDASHGTPRNRLVNATSLSASSQQMQLIFFSSSRCDGIGGRGGWAGKVRSLPEPSGGFLRSTAMGPSKAPFGGKSCRAAKKK